MVTAKSTESSQSLRNGCGERGRDEGNLRRSIRLAHRRWAKPGRVASDTYAWLGAQCFVHSPVESAMHRSNAKRFEKWFQAILGDTEIL